MRGSLLYYGTAGFVSGVALRSFFPAHESVALGGPFTAAVFFVVLGVVVGAYAFALRAVARRRRGRMLFVALVITALGLGIVRFDLADRERGAPTLDALVGERIASSGVVVDEPDERDTNTKLVIAIEDVSATATQSPSRSAEHALVLVTTDTLPAFRYGDRVSLSGVLGQPDVFVGEDGREFDYATYLGKDDIFYQMFYPDIELVSHEHGNPVRRMLFSLKGAFLNNTNRVIPEPESSLLGGLLLGAKRSLGEALEEDFRMTGIIHIVVLSGYNVTIVAYAIMHFFAFLPRRFGLLLGALSIVLFAVMTGASATIVRASIMAIIVVTAKALHRPYAIHRALLLAGLLMVLHNPKIVLFDASFQLSFTATVGLIYLAPHLERYVKWLPVHFGLREFAIATVATQLFVLPMILYKMGTLSLVALPVNLLILATVPATMLVGFLTGVVGFASTALSLPFAYLAYALLAYQLAVVDLFARLPFAALHINIFPLALAVASYALFGVLLLYLQKNTSRH